MNIGNHFHNRDIVQPDVNSYVSWWPGMDGADFGIKDFVKDIFKPQEGRRNLTLNLDLNIEGYLPDHIIRMNSSEAKENDMRAAWRAVLDKDSHYKSMRKNCSTIVSRVLHAGGFHARKWALNCNFAWTPADVKKLALSAGGTLMRWDDFVEILEQSGINMFGWPTQARSGRFCSTGVPVKYQQNGV
jgi:hypothetical protein